MNEVSAPLLWIIVKLQVTVVTRIIILTKMLILLITWWIL